jgi:hypothetical protein
MLILPGNLGRYPSVKIAATAKQVHRTIGNFPRHIAVCKLHKAFNIPYIYNYITKLCRQQAEILQMHGKANVRSIGQGKPRHRKCKRLKAGGGQAYNRSVFGLLL